jgi:hypothetical protein
MFLGIDQMRAHVILHHLSHQPGHGAACAGDEVHDLLASRFSRKRSFNAINLPSNAANAG